MGKFTEKTKQGYDILSIVRVSDNNKAVVFKREFKDGKIDFAWGNYYNEEDGSWGHGHYDFTTQEAATKDMLAFKATEGNKSIWNIVMFDYDEYGSEVEQFTIKSYKDYNTAKTYLNEMYENDQIAADECGNTPERIETISGLMLKFPIEFLNNVYDGYLLHRRDNTLAAAIVIVESQPE